MLPVNNKDDLYILTAFMGVPPNKGYVSVRHLFSD